MSNHRGPFPLTPSTSLPVDIFIAIITFWKIQFSLHTATRLIILNRHVHFIVPYKVISGSFSSTESSPSDQASQGSSVWALPNLISTNSGLKQILHLPASVPLFMLVPLC